MAWNRPEGMRLGSVALMAVLVSVFFMLLTMISYAKGVVGSRSRTVVFSFLFFIRASWWAWASGWGTKAGGLRGFDITDETFDGINRDLRGLGFSGSKASYELRKICIDHICQRFGAEKAVSISGDDIRTISRYYADPAQPNIGAVRVMEFHGF